MSKTLPVTGIHHITAIASDPQEVYDFYAGLLGLRLVKKSVNQDDVATYHLFFGDRLGHPGMDLTFFTFQPAYAGQHGVGQVDTISLTVPETSLDFWKNRLQQHGVEYAELELFGQPRLRFTDADGQRLELVGVAAAALPDGSDVWETAEVSVEVAIRSFYSARLSVASSGQLASVLDVFGYQKQAEEQEMVQYRLPENGRGVFLEIAEQPLVETGLNAAGTVHHIAFGVRNQEHQLAVRAEIQRSGLFPTEVIDRYYFQSVYFRTEAGILFELATLEPGFAVDEPESTLGETLALPPFLEPYREAIEEGLTPLRVEKR